LNDPVCERGGQQGLRLDGAGVENQSPLIAVDRLRKGLTRTPLIVFCTTPENVIQRLWIVGWSGRLHANQFEVKRVRDPTGDFTLQREEVAEVAVEPISPQILVILGID